MQTKNSKQRVATNRLNRVTRADFVDADAKPHGRRQDGSPCKAPVLPGGGSLAPARSRRKFLTPLARTIAASWLCVALFYPGAGLAAPVTWQQASNAVLHAAAMHYPAAATGVLRFKSQFGVATRSVARLEPLRRGGTAVGYVATLNPSGFYLVATDDQLPPWKFRSDTGHFTNLPPGLVAVLKLEMAEDQQVLSNLLQAGSSPNPQFHQQWQSLLAADGQTTATAKVTAKAAGVTLLNTTWNQSDPYNYYAPTIAGGPGGRAWAGCTACALAQILRYSSLPAAVKANHTYTLTSGSCPGTYSIKGAGMGAYNWANMPDSIGDGSPQVQQQAIGQLMYHCGVAVNSDFDPNTTLAAPNLVPVALQTYWGYKSGALTVKSSYSDAQWYSKIAADIDANRPVFYAMWQADMSNGHTVVCDGYQDGNQIHLNLGWGGSYNDWYNIDSVSASGYTWTIHNAIFGILPPGLPPTVTQQPASEMVNLHGTAAFSVAVAGTAPFTYQWRNGGANISGATSPTLTLSGVQSSQAGTYTVVIANAYGSVTSGGAVLTVNYKPQTIVFGPLPYKRLGAAPFTLSATASSGKPVTFSSSNPGVATVSNNLVTITGAGSTIITASQAGGATYLPASTNQTLNVGIPPGIAVQPASLTVFLNDTAILSVTPTGTAPFAYQWRMNNVSLSNLQSAALASGNSLARQADKLVIKPPIVIGPPPGTDTEGPTLTLVNVQTNQAGNYSVVITNAWGSITSSMAVLSVDARTPQTINFGPLPSLRADAAPFTLSATASSGLPVTYSSSNTNVATVKGSTVTLNYTAGTTVITASQAGNASYRPASSNQTLRVTMIPGTVVVWGDNRYGQTEVPTGLSGVIAIATGDQYILALKSDGTIVAWGDNYSGEATVPPGLSNVIAIAAGSDFSAALKSDGTVVAWGNNSLGQTNVPANLNGVTAIAAGGAHAVALKRDGTVVAWGDNYHGQTNIPPGVSNVSAIAAGGHCCLALKSDGTIVAWGDDTWGQLNVPSGLSNVTALAADEYHSVALRGDGTVVTWGGDYTVPPGLSSVTAISAGYDSTAALLDGGMVVAWGFNGFGESTVPPGLREVSAIAAGVYDTAAIISRAMQTIKFGSLAVQQVGAAPFALNATASSGLPVTYSCSNPRVAAVSGNTVTIIGAGITSITASQAGNPAYQPASASRILCVAGMPGAAVAWGYNGYGETNVPSGLTNVTAIAADGKHTVALRSDGTVVAWGDNSFGQTNVPPGLGGVASVAAGDANTLALKTNGTVVVWGDNSFGQTNVPSGLSNVIAIAAGGAHTVALQGDGTVVAWGYDGDGEATVPPGLTGVIAIAAGMYHTLALKSDGTIVAWGINYSGQTNIPPGVSNVIAIAAGAEHSVALKSNGTVVAWGNNTYAQTNVPPGLSGVTALAAGSYHTLALKSDGSIVAWGDNYSGQTNIPPGVSNVTAIAAGAYHDVAIVIRIPQTINLAPFAAQSVGTPPFTLSATASSGLPVTYSSSNPNVATVSGNTVAITGAGLTTVTASQPGNGLYLPAGASQNLFVFVPGVPGTVVAWGQNSGGQTNVPPGLSNVTAIAAGDYHAVALNSDGTVVAWGDNSWGQTNLPLGLNGVMAIAASGDYTVALKRDGTVVTWGPFTPVPPGLSGVTAIATAANNTGASHTVALRYDGSVVAWGDDSSGETDVPPGLNGVVAVAAGVYHTVALKSDGSVVAWGNNNWGQTNVPSRLRNVTAIAAGGNHTIALKNAGTVVAWGDNLDGESTGFPPETLDPSTLSGVTSIATGTSHTVALMSNGTMVGWGDNYYGETSTLPGLENVKAVAAGDCFTMAIVSPPSPHAISHSAINRRPITINFAIGSSGAISKGVLNLRLTGAAGSSVLLERSADLTTWTPFQTNTLGTNILSAGELNLALPTGTNRQQFFRARTQP